MNMTALLMTSALMISSSAAWSAATIGTPAPDATLRDTTGAVHQISDLQGKTVVLEWTNHDCPFVQKHYGSDNMQRLQREVVHVDPDLAAPVVLVLAVQRVEQRSTVVGDLNADTVDGEVQHVGRPGSLHTRSVPRGPSPD